MSDYDVRAQATAARMLAPKPAGKGQVVTLTQPATGGTYDPATGATTPATPAAEVQGSGVVDSYSDYTVASGAVQAGDRKLLLSALKTDGSLLDAPDVGRDVIELADGSTHQIVSVKPLGPAGTVIMYELQLRAE